jgi:hypothetical protein
VLVVGVDAVGALHVYVPWAGAASVPLAAGADVSLPGSLVLDDAPGTEHLGVLITPEPLILEAVERAIVNARSAGAPLAAALAAVELPGSQHWFELAKEDR